MSLGHRVLFDLFAAPFTMPDPGDAGVIAVDRWNAVVELVTAAAETRTLSDPLKSGLRLLLALKTDGGDCVVTADTAINQTGNTIMTFADAKDSIVLESVPNGSAYKWSVMGNDGVDLS